MRWIKADAFEEIKISEAERDEIIKDIFDKKMKGWLSENFQRNITDEEWNKIIDFFRKNDNPLFELYEAYNTNPYDAVDLLREYWDKEIK